jgi:hypothetical protein
MMEKILNEQAFQMTGAVDEAYMVKVGRIAGVSRIVSGNIVMIAKGTYAVSAKMVDVESGSILASASEKRTGDSFEVNQRMLRNLAFVLAGKTTADHEEYLKMAARETREQQLSEKTRHSRFYIRLNSLSALPLHLFQPGDEGPRKAFYEKETALTAWGVPKDGFNIGSLLTTGFRLTERWWLVGTGGYSRSGLRKGYAVANYYNDTTLYVGSRPDTIRTEGPDDILSRSERTYVEYTMGLGVKWQFFRNPRIALGIAAVPEFGWMTCTERSYDSSFTSNNLYLNGVFMGKEQIYSQDIRETHLSGTAFGGSLNGDVEIRLSRNIGINLTCGLGYLLAGTLRGKTNVSSYEIDRSPFEDIVVDTSYSENAALVRGNFLGTGEFFQIENPDVKQKDPDGKPVNISRASKEFASFRMTLGILYYF